jgi:hypothetical protein
VSGTLAAGTNDIVVGSGILPLPIGGQRDPALTPAAATSGGSTTNAAASPSGILPPPSGCRTFKHKATSGELTTASTTCGDCFARDFDDLSTSNRGKSPVSATGVLPVPRRSAQTPGGLNSIEEGTAEGGDSSRSMLWNTRYVFWNILPKFWISRRAIFRNKTSSSKSVKYQARKCRILLTLHIGTFLYKSKLFACDFNNSSRGDITKFDAKWSQKTFLVFHQTAP